MSLSYVLPRSLVKFFDRDIYFIKSIGANIAFQARQEPEKIRDIFQHPDHFSFFCYGFDKFSSLTQLVYDIRSEFYSAVFLFPSDPSASFIFPGEPTHPFLIEIYGRLKHAVSLLKAAEDRAALRFFDTAYCTKKIVKLVFSEMLYESQRAKEIGGKKGEFYSSNCLVRLRGLQKDYGKLFLSSKFVKIEGETISLMDFVATAEKKASELYAKVKGLQSLADEKGMGWAFLTMTAPPEYHPNPKSGRSTWDRQNVKGAHQYLKAHWDALGKDLKNRGIYMNSGDIFGARVVEPHKDGTPHWHVVIFYKKHLENKLFTGENPLFSKHFEHSPSALKIVIGDVTTKKGPRKGGKKGCASAASYCFKYILKSLGADISAKSDDPFKQDFEKKVIERIDAWKAAMGIRAFSFFGISGKSAVWSATRKIAHQAGYVSKDDGGVYQFTTAPPANASNDYHPFLHLSKDEVAEKLHTLTPSLKRKIEHSLKEISLHQDLNSDLSKEEAIEKFYSMTLIMKKSTSGSFAGFIKICAMHKVDLIRESTINKYGETCQKIIGINAGIRIHLFKTHEITTKNTGTAKNQISQNQISQTTYKTNKIIQLIPAFAAPTHKTLKISDSSFWSLANDSNFWNPKHQQI